MISKKLAVDLVLVACVFSATAGIVEAQKIYQGYIDPACIDFQLRSQTVEGQITDGLQSGKLTQAVAESLITQLEVIRSNAPKDLTGLTNARLHSQLDRLSSQIDLEMKDRTVVSSKIADIVSKKSNIAAQLSATALSPAQRSILEKKLARISAYESYLLTNSGGLTYWQRKKINAELDLLASQLTTSTVNRNKVSLLRNQ